MPASVGHRRRLAVTALALTLAASAACSSSSGSSGAPGTRDDATGTSTTTATTPGSPAPACTTDAATAAMTAGNRALGIVCNDGWASGPYSTGIIEAAYLARADGASWRILDSSEFGRACARDNPLRIPADVRAQSPCGVS